MFSQLKSPLIFLLLLCTLPSLLLCQYSAVQQESSMYDSYEPYAYQGAAYSTVEHHHQKKQQPSGCDYEEKVLKARAIVDVLSNQANQGAAVHDGSSGLGLMGKQWLVDERFRWMRPFEFYECGQGQEF